MGDEIQLLKHEVETEQAVEQKAANRARMKIAVTNILASIKRNEKAVADYQKRVDDDKKALAGLTLENCQQWQYSALNELTGGSTWVTYSTPYPYSYATNIASSGTATTSGNCLKAV